MQNRDMGTAIVPGSRTRLQGQRRAGSLAPRGSLGAAGAGRGDVRGPAPGPGRSVRAEGPGAAPRVRAGARGGPAVRGSGPGRGRAEPCAAPSMREPPGRAAAAQPAGAAAAEPCCWPRQWWCGNG